MANMICVDIAPVEQAMMQDLLVVYGGKSTLLRSVHPTQRTFFQLLQQVTKAIVDDIIAITGDHQTVMIQLYCDLPGSEDVMEIASDADMKKMLRIHQDDVLILLLAETTVIETLSCLRPRQVNKAA